MSKTSEPASSRQADLARWAEELIRNKSTGNSDVAIQSLANRQLVSELQESNFWISDETLCALEIISGDKPVSYQQFISGRTQEAINALDEVVRSGCQIVDGRLTGFDIAKVKAAYDLCPAQKVKRYAQLIDSVNKRVRSMQVSEDTLELAGSLARIAATRPVLRTVRRAQEKQRQRSYGVSLTNMKLKELESQCGELLAISAPFLTQLKFDRENELLELAAPTPTTRTQVAVSKSSVARPYQAGKAKSGWGGYAFAIIIGLTIITKVVIKIADTNSRDTPITLSPNNTISPVAPGSPRTSVNPGTPVEFDEFNRFSEAIRSRSKNPFEKYEFDQVEGAGESSEYQPSNPMSPFRAPSYPDPSKNRDFSNPIDSSFPAQEIEDHQQLIREMLEKEESRNRELKERLRENRARSSKRMEELKRRMRSPTTPRAQDH